MKAVVRTWLFLVAVAPALATVGHSQTSSLQGTVRESATQMVLPGASVQLFDGEETPAAGTATDREGRFLFEDLAAGDYRLTVTYIGYEPSSSPIQLTANELTEIDVELSPLDINLGNVVVSSTRRRERLMDTPSSVSILSAREIAPRAGTSTSDVLRTVTGVNLVYTGVETTEISLRGFNNVFSNDALFLANDRQTNLVAWSLTFPNVSPGRLDIDKVEVVRGPGASLYGGGSDVGVVHYVTKDPFDHPGTAVSVSGGERSYKSFELRHAGTGGTNDQIGYKLNVQHLQGDDWTYDPSDSLDAGVLDRMIDLDDNRSDFDRTQVDAQVALRMANNRELIFDAGRTYLTGNRLGGVGRFLMDRAIVDYAQARFRQGGFFAQSYLYRTVDSGKNLFYDVDFDKDGAADSFIEESLMYVAQVQYDRDFGSRHNMVVGGDADWQKPRSGGTLFGVFEDRDLTRELGAYLQTRHALSDKIDVNLGIRADHHSVLDDLYLTPRASVVFKPASNHRLRASFVRGFRPPTPSELFGDLDLGTLFGPVEIRLVGRPQDTEWERNADYTAFAGSDVVSASIIPGMEGTRTPAGIPIDLVYGLVYGGLAPLPPAVLAGALQQAGVPASEQEAASILAQLSPTSTPVGGFSKGEFRLLDPSNGQFAGPVTPGTVPATEPRFVTSLELGYKGLIGRNLIFEVELHRSHFRNFTDGIGNYAPFLFVPDLGADLESSIADGIAANPTLTSELGSLGLSPEDMSAFLMGLIGGAPIDADTPIGIVQPVQEGVPGEGEAPLWHLHQDQRGEVTLWGVDVSFEARPAPRWTVYGNLAWVHKNQFDGEDAGVDDPDFLLETSTPNIITSAGAQYEADTWSLYASARYRGQYERRQSLPIYTGVIPAFWSLDVSGSYDLSRFAPGLVIDVNIRNALNDRRREIPGAPRIGRFGQVRLTYTVR